MAQSSWLVAVDNSGSTAAMVDGQYISDYELDFCRKLTADLSHDVRCDVVLWSSHVETVISTKGPITQQRMHSGGGTNPSVVLLNAQIRRELESGYKVFCLVTDGEIPLGCVNAVTNNSALYSHLPVLVVVVTREFDFSVAAPFVSLCANASILHCVPGRVPQVKCVYAKGAFAPLNDVEFSYAALRAILNEVEPQHCNLKENANNVLESQFDHATNFTIPDDFALQCHVMGIGDKCRKWLNDHALRFERERQSRGFTDDLARAMAIKTPKTRAQEILKLKQAVSGLTTALSAIQCALKTLCELERCGFTPDALALVNSNRELRAKHLEVAAYDGQTINWSGEFPMEECPVMMDIDHPVLLLSKSDSKFTDDFVLNYPFVAQANHVLAIDQIGLVAASTIWEIDPCGPYSRTRFDAILPLTAFKCNANLIRSVFATVLTDGRAVPALMLIAFSVFANIKCQYAKSGNESLVRKIDYVVQQLLDFARTEPNFDPTSSDKRVSLREAFSTQSQLLNNNETSTLYKQPDAAFALVSRYLTLNDTGKRLLTTQRDNDKAVKWYVNCCKETSVTAAQQQLTSCLYETRHGVAIAGTARLIQDNPALTDLYHSLLDYNGASYRSDILVQTIWLQCPQIFNGTTYDRQQLLDKINNRYYRHGVDAAHNVTPPFVNCYGPSVLHCVCGYSFVDGGGGDDKVEDRIRLRRRAHFREVYRCTNPHGNPDETSYHYNLHKSMRRAFTDGQMSDEEITRKTLELLMADGHGYIHDPNIDAKIAFLLPSLRNYGPCPADERITLQLRVMKEQQVGGEEVQ